MRAPDSKIKSDNATLDSAQYMAERWHKVELLLSRLGIDANTVMVDIGPYWQKLDYLKPQQSLREELEELIAQYLKIPNKLALLTPLQSAALFRETLPKADALLAELNKPPSLSEFHRYLVPAKAAKKAVTEYADVLRWLIAQCEEEGSSSRQNASKKRRNDCWLDLAELWQKITARCWRNRQVLKVQIFARASTRRRRRHEAAKSGAACESENPQAAQANLNCPAEIASS